MQFWKITSAPGGVSPELRVTDRDGLFIACINYDRAGVPSDRGWSVTWATLHDLNTNGLRSKDAAIGYVIGVEAAMVNAEAPPQLAAIAHFRRISDKEAAAKAPAQ